MRIRPKLKFEQKWIWPCESKTIRSPHGMRMHPIHNKLLNHDGIDIGARYEEVWAVADGRVVAAQWNGGYGNYIEIDHGNGIHSFYGHLNSYSVNPDNYVTQGQVIGEVGSTGRSTGSHLHFGVHKNGQKFNPLDFLPKF